MTILPIIELLRLALSATPLFIKPLLILLLLLILLQLIACILFDRLLLLILQVVQLRQLASRCRCDMCPVLARIRLGYELRHAHLVRVIRMLFI